MPKELTHWWLAAQALHQLPGESPIHQLLAAETPAYLTGAVLPDTLLHLVFGPASSTALRLAGVFHEPPGNSFTPLVRFVEQQHHNPEPDLQANASSPAPCPLPFGPALCACLLGVASHMLADIVFHPYICARSGNDIGQHYRYETELDLWLLQTGRKPPVRRLKEVLTESAADAAVAVSKGLFDPAGELPPKAFRQALQLHKVIQGMYGSPGWQLLALGLSVLPVPFLRSHHKLFYPFGRQRGRSLSWPDHWVHRATGRTEHQSPDQLADAAVNRMVQLLKNVDAVGLREALTKQPGENLITGMPALTPPDHTPTRAAATARQ